MRVFVTGAAGYVGSAATKELVKHGHQVLGLARNEANVKAIREAGGEPHSGDLKDLESLKSGAQAADGVMHLGFIHDWSDIEGSCATDRAAITAIGEVLQGTGKPFVVASGVLGLPPGPSGLATEESEPEKGSPFSFRAASADLVYEMSKKDNVRGSVVRFAPTVHGSGDHGFIDMLINMFRQKGKIIQIGDGSTRWPAVHREDTAVLLRLALEKGTPGSTYHSVAEQGVSMKDIMGAMGKHLNLPMESASIEQAQGDLGFFAFAIGTDSASSSEKTQKELGWTPTQPGLLADMEAHYFG